MNQASLAAFCLYFSEHRGKPIDVVAVSDEAGVRDAASFVRMVGIWPWVVNAVVERQARARTTDNDASHRIVVPFGDVAVKELAAENGSLLLPKVPALDDPLFGFFQEMETHDYEIGGVNEWNESIPCIYSRFVLQSLSAYHVYKSFPHYAWPDIQRIATAAGAGAPLRTLDIGCGPISKLRWGALEGLLHITGVDPLNNIYSSILVRHGLDTLPKIRPDTAITGFAEELDFRTSKFHFAFSVNALDHTQDLPAAISHIIESLHVNGVALINLCTREGERNSYQGLHKFNVWVDSGNVYYNTKTTAPVLLNSAHPAMIIEKIYWSNDQDLAFLMRRATQ